MNEDKLNESCRVLSATKESGLRCLLYENTTFQREDQRSRNSISVHVHSTFIIPKLHFQYAVSLNKNFNNKKMKKEPEQFIFKNTFCSVRKKSYHQSHPLLELLS